MKTRTLALFIASAILGFLPVFSTLTYAQGNQPVDLVFFYGRGCPHCSRMAEFLVEMKETYPHLNIHGHEVYSNPNNAILFQKMADVYGRKISGVPTVYIGEKIIAGFSTEIGKRLESVIISCIEHSCRSPFRKLQKPLIEQPQEQPDRPDDQPGKVPEAPAATDEQNPAQDIPQTKVASIEEADGRNEPEDTGSKEAVNEGDPEEKATGPDIAQALTISAVISAAAVDAINPCAFAVLIILITTVLASGRKRRALCAGLAFSLSIFISYFLMGIGLYSAIQASGFTHAFYAVIGVLAILIGLFNLKDYFWYGKWFVMEVPMSWRPAMKAMLRSVTSVPGAFLVGFAVSLFLLPCTSGPYIIILGLLAKATTRNHALALLILYNLIFVSPMVLITGAVYFGLTTTECAEAWRQKCLRTLHLIAGLIILALGIGMLIALWLGMV